MSHRLLATLAIFAALLVCQPLVPSALAQTERTKSLLPMPTGPLPIGRMAMRFEDRSRIEPLSPEHRFREIMVDIWYPAALGEGLQPAAYIDLPGFEEGLGTAGMQDLFGSAYGAIKDGRVRTHAVDGAPFASSLQRCPLLVFSHGMGTVSQIYTAQFEDLASYGYVVAALTHTYDATLTLFPDGRRVVIDMASRPGQGSPEEKQIAYESQRIEWWAADIRFVLDELTRINRTKPRTMSFAGHLDLDRVAVFGHSVGGEAAARACQLDSRFRVCLNQDGLQRFAPFHLDANGWGLNQQFLLIMRARSAKPPSDKELAAMKMTLAEAQAFVGKLQATQEHALESTGRGSYRVLLNHDAITHMTFSDLPVLQAHNPAETESRTNALETILSYDRSFFDKYLRGAPAPLLDEPKRSEFVDAVQWFRPGVPPRK